MDYETYKARLYEISPELHDEMYCVISTSDNNQRIHRLERLIYTLIKVLLMKE